MTKLIYFIFITIGSFVGSWVASLFGVGYFSIWSIIAGGIGSIAGIYFAYKLNTNYMGS